MRLSRLSHLNALNLGVTVKGQSYLPYARYTGIPYSTTTMTTNQPETPCYVLKIALTCVYTFTSCIARALPPIHTKRTTGVAFCSRSRTNHAAFFIAATGSTPGSTRVVGFLAISLSTGVKMARMRVSPSTAVAVSRSLIVKKINVSLVWAISRRNVGLGNTYRSSCTSASIFVSPPGHSNVRNATWHDKKEVTCQSLGHVYIRDWYEGLERVYCTP